MMPSYMTFYYKFNGQDYIEAYPTHGQPVDWIQGELNKAGTVVSIAWMSSPSRNQARRAAYMNWIRADGTDFNQLPYRSYTL